MKKSFTLTLAIMISLLVWVLFSFGCYQAKSFVVIYEAGEGGIIIGEIIIILAITS